MQTHWYMINVNFQEALVELLERSLPNLNKHQVMNNMNVAQEAKMAKRFMKSSTDLLRLLKIEYSSEWPLEIVIDQQTIVKKYNIILRLLLQIKFAKFVMEKRDYHLKKPNLLRYSHSYSAGKLMQQKLDDISARERLRIDNELMLGRLIQQLQVF